MNPDMAGERVLICDDEAHIRLIIGSKLSSAGYDVQPAEDGEECVKTARVFRPDIILMDHDMPFLMGLAAAKELEACIECRDIPIIMISGRSHRLESKVGSNVKVILSKPFSARDVLSAVAEALQMAAANSSASMAE